MEKSHLYILSNGKVGAINKADGSIVWQIELKQYVKSGLSYAIGEITCEGDKLYIGCSGHLVCLSAVDGSLIWVNKLKGWGWQFVSIANAGNSEEAAETARRAATAAVIAASTAS